MDYPDSEFRVTTATTAPEECGSNLSWLWIVLFLIALAGVIGLAIWVGYLYHSKSNCKDKIINFKNPKIQVISDSSIKGIWDDTGNKNDVVTLYATLDPPQFTSDGKLTNSETRTKSQQASPGAINVTLDGLQPQLKYYATLIVTNSSSSTNYQSFTQLVYMFSQTPDKSILAANNTPTNNTFAIEDIIQVGKLEAQVTAGATGPFGILFKQKPSEANSLWYMNNNNQIQLDERSGTENICLFRDTDGSLIAKECGTTGSIDTTNSVWTYNQGPGTFTNRWCLTNTINTTSPACMVLNPIGSNEQATVKVGDSTVGDAWAIAFENPN